ncbi:MAG TPA: hypothetical protein VM914_08475, partial [Pyrinomonadaceae bacterium]|nr:hypothetical protein [Pyrinomonadaceae bacterium]
LCGILFALGLLVRPAALLMVINFVAALVIAHLDAPLDAAGSRSACSSRRSSGSLTGRARSRSTGISKGAGRV